MRNLKKALSLVLALVFVLGLCTIGAGAAFTDDAQIQYKEAITIMNGLGILEGYGDGKFGPLDNVTREQAAKMITYMVLGADSAEKLISKQVFDDVAATRWSAKYIYFCYQKGIINGYGDGNFGPADPVTGIQLAKMLLSAIGYGCMGEYTGEGWDVNVFIDAVSEGVYEDANTASYDVAATREEAALYVFNTLFIENVAYDVDMNVYEGRTFNLAGKVWDLFGSVYENPEGVYMVKANQATGADYTEIGDKKFAIETGLDLIGHDVEVYYKNTPKKDANGTTYYEAYLVEDVSTVHSVGYYSVYLADFVKAMGYPETPVDEIVAFHNYAEAGTYAGTTYLTAEDKAFDASAKKAHTVYADAGLGAAPYANFVVNNDGDIVSYMTSSWIVAEVDEIYEGVIVVDTNNGSGFPVEYFPVDTDEENADRYSYAYDGIAEGDYVTIMKNGDLYTILPTTVVTATIHEIGLYSMFFNNYALMASGTNWGDVNESGWLPVTYNNGYYDAPGYGQVQLGYTYNFYVDAMGSFFGVELVSYGESAGYVAVIEKFDVASTNSYASAVTYYYAQCVDGEGNEVIYQLEESEYNALPSTTNGEGQEIVNAVYRVDTYTCTTTTDDAYGKSVVKFVPDDYAVNDDEADFDGNGTDLKVCGDYFADSAKIFYVEGAEDLLLVTEVKTPGEEDDVAVGYVKDAAGTVTTLWIFNTAPVIYADSYIYVTSEKGYNAAQGSTALGSYFSLYIDGVLTSNITVNAADLSYGSLEPTFYAYTVDANGIYDLEKIANFGSQVGDAAYVDDISISETAKNLYKGMLSGSEFDDVDVSDFAVVNMTGAVNPNTGKYYVCNDVDDIASLIAKGLTVDVRVVVVEDAAGDPVPTGVIYVTAIG